jgi:DNA (cytosine-5)-methyltransferase 1
VSTTELTSAGLFAGIGGIELGLERADIHTELLCEIDPDASAVLRARFPDVQLASDVRKVKSLPKVDVLAAGFPCQDLSQAGKKAGIEGTQSSLVGEVFRLCQSRRSRPTWLVLENVSYMLRLDRGRAMTQLVRELEELGFQWGYRVVDARAFGVPQRRQRVLFVASATEDVRGVLFADEGDGVDYADAIGPVDPGSAYGFYWTEGLRGLGWAKDAVPTVKGGSRLGIPSPPAVWLPDESIFGTPSLEDAERLQGFEPGWTEPALSAGGRRGSRWRLIGNAVCVPMAAWLGRRLVQPGAMVVPDRPLWAGDRWPTAAWGAKGESFAVDATMNPDAAEFDLRAFLKDPLQPLSVKAASGFLSRARRGKLRFADGFLDDLEDYIEAEVGQRELIA